MKKQLLFQLIGCAIIVLLIRDLNFAYFAESFHEINFTLLLVSVLFLLLSIACKIGRWWYILRVQGVPYDLTRAGGVFFIGQFFATITPGRIGDVIKIFYLEKETALSHFKALANVLVDRLFDIATLALMASAFLAVGALPEGERQTIWACAAGIILALVVVTRPAAVDALFKFFERVPILKRFLNRQGEFVGEMLMLLRRLASAAILAPCALTAVSYLLLFWHAYFLAGALNMSVTYPKIAMILTFASVAALIPFSIGGIGPREAATKHLFVAVFGGAAVSTDAAQKLGAQGVAFSLAYHLIFAVTIGVIGFIGWLRSPVSVDSLKRLSRRIFKGPQTIHAEPSQ